MKMNFAIVPLVAMGLVGAGLAVGLTNDPRELPSMLIDKPMPEFDLPALRPQDPNFRRDDLDGAIAMVNVFASWCVSCRLEHPTLMRLARESRVPIHGVDWKDSREDGLAWLGVFGDPYTRLGEDVNSKLAIELGVTGAPETYIIDRSGRIRYKQIGPITDDVWKETIEPLIRALEQENAG